MFKRRHAKSIDPWSMYEVLAARERAGLSAPERRLVALGSLRIELNNGGFHQYFYNSAGDLVGDAVGAAAEAGATELADLVRRALDILNLSDPADRDTRQCALDEIEPEDFQSLDAAFLALESSADLDALMGSFAT